MADGERTEPQRKWCHLGAAELDRLDHASLIIFQAFDTHPYLVGSCLVHEAFRDVDVRLILADDEYDRLFGMHPAERRTNPMWSLFCASVSEYLSRLTSLPIDFQVQSRTHANTTYKNGKRQPLGVYPTDAHSGDSAPPS